LREAFLRILNGFLVVTLLVAPLSSQAQEGAELADKQRRIDQYQALRLIVETDSDKQRVLRQGPDRIYDIDFVTLFDEPSLRADFERERAFDFARWLGSAAVGIPLGSALFLDNFRGEGALALFKDGLATSNAAHPLAFVASSAGAVATLWGVYLLSLWVTEVLDLRHPNRLEDIAIKPRVTAYNDALRERLNLEESDIPPPPTPRPSATATPGESARPGVTAPVGGPDGQPGGILPSVRPQPLETLTPGSTPPELFQSPKPRASVFRFPVMPRFESPSAQPSPAPVRSG
jgi:hypothetical protein